MWAMPWTSRPADRSRGPGGQHGPRVDPGRGQEDLAQRGHRLVGRRRHGRVRLGVAERSPQPRLVRLGEVQVPLRDERPDEREAVGVQPGGGQADDRVTRPDRAAVDDVGPLDDADAAPGQVELVRVHETGMLRGLATDEGASGVAAAGGDRPDQLADPLGHDLADRHVVEERERLGAAAHDIVGAHRDQVDADRVEASERRGDGGLRPDAVGRGHQQRLAVAGGDADRAPEAPQPAGHLGPTGGLDVRAHQVDRPVAGGDVHAGRLVGTPRVALAVRAVIAAATYFARPSSPGLGQASAPTTSSSMNLRLEASYGTGSG